MARQFEDEVAYYYDFHPTEEDLMGETSVHADLVSYLMAVLRWQFREQRCAIYENLNFYQTPDSHTHLESGEDMDTIFSFGVTTQEGLPKLLE